MTARLLLGLAAALVLAACARTGAPDASATPAPGTQTVGYVHMDELVKVHPLYGQLARYDENIQALNLSTIVPKTLAAAPELARREAELQKELEDAAKRTDLLLAQKSKEYQQRESEAIAAALKVQSGGGTSVGAVQSQVQQTTNDQVATVGAQAQRDLDAYQKQLETQDAAQLDAVQKTLAARADRTYRAKVDELNAKEATLSLKLATDDSAERLSLRTKLASLALDDSARQDAKARLDALDKTEADAIAAERAQDQQTLAALQAQLKAGVQRDLQAQIAPIHARSQARFAARETELHGQFAAPAGPLIAATGKGGTAVVNPNLPPAVREKIQHLHDDYAKAFQQDAGTTIADFKKTREMLKKRYDALTGMNDDAARDVQNEIASLQRKREELYDQMVAQIGREVQVVARQRGVSVVISDVAATAGGIDLTADAKKDIETLHE